VDEITIGARLRTLRRWRGKSQVELAGLAGLSPSFISMVETGQRPLDRRSHIAALANALKVSETDLVGGPHLSQDPLQADPHMGIPALRVALETNTLTTPAVDRARPLRELVQEVTDRIEPMRRACNYVATGQMLPDVLDELHYHVAAPADHDAERPRTQVEAVQWLRRAENAAPQRIRNSAPVRETVAYLLNRARAAAGGRELRGMAARMGVPH
jgi:transcriptional regulator with XRE-family HTH domain